MKKLVSILTSLILVAGIVSGCGKQENKNTGEVNKPKEITLKTVSMFGGTDPNAKTYQALNKAFTSANPYVTIEDDSTTSNNEWKTKIAADFAVGNEPDVLFFFTDAQANDVLKANKFVTVDEIS